MPYARVGIFPTPTPSRKDGRQQQSADCGGKTRSNRQKGITMEDLKKQTAIRLAQEQQQQNRSSSSSLSEFNPFGFGRSRSSAATSGPSSTVSANAEYHTSGAANTEYRTSRQTPVAHHAANPTGTDSSRYYDKSSGTAGTKKSSKTGATLQTLPGMAAQSGSRSPRYQQDQHNRHSRHNQQAQLSQHNQHSQHSHRQQNHRQPNQHNQQTPQSQSNQHSQHSQHGRYQQSAGMSASPMHSTTAHCFDTPSAHQGLNSASKSKLPHGLTVHELKEMTKARLHAEAAEKHETDCGRLSAYDQQDVPAERESVASDGVVNLNSASDHGSRFLRPRFNSSDSRGSAVPSVAQVRPLGADLQQVSSHPPHVSPPGQNYRSLSHPTSPFPDSNTAELNRSSINRTQQEPKADAWETASVASYNSNVASEYLGSECAYPPVVNAFASQGGGDDLSGVPFGRSRSYPQGNGGLSGAPEMPSYESNHPPMNFPGTSPFEANRRRASTLSPRPGLTLLHEHRPFANQNDLGIPSFSSEGRRPPSIFEGGGNFSSPVGQQQSLSLMQGFPSVASASSNRYRNSTGTGFNGDTEDDFFNRPRTVSLPAMSQTAEEFFMDRNAPSSFLHGGNLIRGTPVKEDMSSNMGDNMLGSSVPLGSYNSNDGASFSSPVLQTQTQTQSLSLMQGFPSVDSASSNVYRHSTGTETIGGVTGDDFFNRARTVSLPAMSQTAEEFFMERSAPSSLLRGGDLRREMHVKDGMPDNINNGILGSSVPHSSNNSSSDLYSAATSSLSSVFRDVSSLALKIAPPPGLLSAMDLFSSANDSGMTNESSSRIDNAASFNDSRVGSNWCNSGISGNTDIFGPSQGLTDGNAGVNSLSDDLASILKLSGAEESRTDGGAEEATRLASGSLGVDGPEINGFIQDRRQL